MKRMIKSSASILTTLSLLVFAMVPALAYTTYSTKTQNYYSTKYYYNYGSYSTKTIYYYSQKPTTTQQQIPTTQKPASQSPVTPTPAPSSSAGLTAEESKMVNLVNQARMGQGLQPLATNQQLSALARKKSQDMVTNNYFSHTSPTYGSPFDMMKQAGITYNTAGENIAGAQTTESAHQNLMNSEGHRANILNPKFTEIGIGIASGSIYGNIFTQMFIGR